MKPTTIFSKIQAVYIAILILLNVGTLYFVSPLSENLSYLGNALEHKFYLIIWGSTAALYFLIYTFRLIKKSKYSNRLGICLFCISCLFMILSVLLPFDPIVLPTISKWHTRIAMWGTIGYVIFFFHYLYDLMNKDYLLFEKSMVYYSFLVSLDALFYILIGGVSTLLEISFTIIMSIIIYYMNQKI